MSLLFNNNAGCLFTGLKPKLSGLRDAIKHLILVLWVKVQFSVDLNNESSLKSIISPPSDALSLSKWHKITKNHEV